MNITEKLLKIDKKRFEEIPTRTYKSKVLSDIVGEDVELTLKVTDSTELVKLSKKASDSDEMKQIEAIRLICVMGIADPDLKSVELKTKLGLDEKSTPIEVIEKLWGKRQLELIDIATEILRLHGLSTKKQEIQD